MNIQKIRIELEKIRDTGWHPASHHHDGGVGNTLETLLKIAENNLKGPDLGTYELKTQRVNARGKTASLLTLKHIEPKPAAVVPSILIPLFGWQHTKQGATSSTNLSFRHTFRANQFTGRGFSARLDRRQNRLIFIFEPTMVDSKNEAWLKSLSGSRLQSMPPIYWDLTEMMDAFQGKLKNCISVSAESRKDPKSNREEYRYQKMQVMHGFDSDLALSAIDSGVIRIEFDASTNHNHGTKFRIPRELVSSLYKSCEEI